MKGGAIRTLYSNPANPIDLPKSQPPAVADPIPEIAIQGIGRPQGQLERTYTPKNMSYSQDLVDFIKEQEDFRPAPYPDPGAGYPTIGYGHKLEKGFDPNMRWTEQHGLEQLRRDMDIAANGVRDKVSVPITQGMMNGLTSMFYNIGPEKFPGTKADKKLHAGDYVGAATEMLTFDNVRKNGQLVPLKGLSDRRRLEAEMALGANKHLLPTGRPKTK